MAPGNDGSVKGHWLGGPGLLFRRVVLNRLPLISLICYCQTTAVYWQAKFQYHYAPILQSSTRNFMIVDCSEIFTSSRKTGKPSPTRYSADTFRSVGYSTNRSRRWLFHCMFFSFFTISNGIPNPASPCSSSDHFSRLKPPRKALLLL